ncbi:MAG: HDOD domain-containing protein, partial [Candidatus Riflebacteria bacterium]
TKYFAEQEERLKHSESVAHLAVKVAERKIRDVVTLGKIRVAGLLHDIGALALQFCFKEEYKKVLDYQQSRKVSIIIAERHFFGLDHCEIGSRLCLEWGLPAYLLDCAREHHKLSCRNYAGIIEPVIIANAFLNSEIGHQITIDYKKLLHSYCPNKYLDEKEAGQEVQMFLYSQWNSFKQSLQQP